MPTDLKIPCPGSPEYWHKHSNGGGWVANTCRVDDSVYVNQSAIIHGNVQISGFVSIFDHAQIFGNVKISGTVQIHGKPKIWGNAKISGNAMIDGEPDIGDHARVFGNAVVYDHAVLRGKARISGCARVYEYASVANALVSDKAHISGYAKIRGSGREPLTIGGGAEVGGYATIYGGTWLQTPLQIQGTRHFVNTSRPGYLKIGCHSHPLEWWRRNYKKCGHQQAYSPKQVEEYGLYIRLAAQWFKIYGLSEPTTK